MIQNRKAISTVVGAVFFIVAFTATITYITYALDLVDKFGQNVLTNDQSKANFFNEQFGITRVTNDNNKFNITVQNTGTIPINVTRLYVQNMSDPNWNDTKYTLNTLIFPGQSVVKIGQNLPLSLISSQSYNLKFVTDRGTTKQVTINSANSKPIYLQLFAIPDTVPTTFTTTVLFAVKNNQSSDSVFLNVYPSTSPWISTTGSATATLLSGPNPVSYPALKGGDMTWFSYSYKITGNNGDTVEFNAGLINGVPNNNATATVTVSDVQNAISSTNSLTSQGVTAGNTASDILMFHSSKGGTPFGNCCYEMFSGNPGAAGTTINFPAGGPITYYTNYTLGPTVFIPRGHWNASLNYRSASVPTVVPSVASILTSGMIFHFNLPNSLANSVQSCAGLRPTLPGGVGHNPSFQNGAGPDGSGAYHFNTGGATQYMYAGLEVSPSNCDAFGIGGADNYTVYGQFKVDTNTYTGGPDYIFYVADQPTGNAVFDVHLGDGDDDDAGTLFFDMVQDDGAATTCKSGNFSAPMYPLWFQQWHSFMAERGGLGGGHQKRCTLYVDGNQVDQKGDGLDSISVDITHTLVIGASTPDYARYQNGFHGYLDNIMLWENNWLNLAQYQAIAQTNFGTNSSDFNFDTYATDTNGVNIKSLNSSYNYPLPFQDQYNLATQWGTANYTFFPSTPGHTWNLTSSNGERIKFNMTQVAGTKGGLPMSFNFDNSGLGLKSSFMETPFPNATYNGYAGYHLGTEFVTSIFNVGNGFWINQAGTKVVFEKSAVQSYGGYIDKAQAGAGPTIALSATQDSPFIANNTSTTLTFFEPSDRPCANISPCGNAVPIGQYNGTIYLQGYDDTGAIVLKAVSLGTVTVSP